MNIKKELREKISSLIAGIEDPWLIKEDLSHSRGVVSDEEVEEWIKGEALAILHALNEEIVKEGRE